MHLNHNLSWLWIIVLISTASVQCKTSSQDVSALNVMYTSLNSPSQLSGWKSSGGDPCGENWEGIKCSGSSVTEINLSDLGLSGSLGYQLSQLTSVTDFDLSNNNFKGDIPYQLPPNARNVDLSKNAFTGNIPYSIGQMKELTSLNLAHNKLNNQLGDMFTSLTKLKQLDVSFNSLSGELPQSLKSATSLKKIHLQNNQLSGSINVLAYPPLDDVNVENNKFTGWIPVESVVNVDDGVKRDCRICHLSMDMKNRDDDQHESGTPIELGCSCKDDLAAAHKQCAEAWFKVKGNKTCEICGSIARNVSGIVEVEMTEQWSEANDASVLPPTRPPPPAETQRLLHRFLNFLLACMVIAFVISWLFRFYLHS